MRKRLSRLIEKRKIFKEREYSMEGVKKQAEIDLISKETLEHDHCYLGIRPTVNTAPIPLLSHPVLRTKPNA